MRERASGEIDTERFSESLEVEPGSFLLELWNKVIRGAEVESYGHSVLTAVMAEAVGKRCAEKGGKEEMQ